MAKTSTTSAKVVIAKIKSLIADRERYGLDSYLLSQLGNDLGQDRVRLEQATGKALSDFIIEDLRYRVAREPGTGALYLYFNDEPTPPPKRVRIRSELWRAFTVPLSAGEARHVNLATFEFGKRETVSVELGPVHPIPDEFIVGTSGRHLADAVSERVVRWLRAFGLDPSQFSEDNRLKEKPGVRDTERQTDSAVGKAFEPLSAIDILRLELTPQQFAKVSIPLDALERLSGKLYRRI